MQNHPNLHFFYFFSLFASFNWWISLGSERQKVSLGLQDSFSILADFNSAVVKIVSRFSLISDSSSLFSKTLGTVSRVPTTIRITVTSYHRLSFLIPRTKIKIFANLLVFYHFRSWFIGTAKFPRCRIILFRQLAVGLDWIGSFVSQVSYSWTNSDVRI